MDLSEPTVAVVLHFRTPCRTFGCLASLASEGIDRVELVDNSEDGGQSMAELRAMLDKRPLGIRVHWHCPERNLGFAAAVNLVLDHLATVAPSRVLLINSDARLQPGAICALQGALADGSGIAVPRERGRGWGGPRGYHRWLALALPTRVPGVVSFPSGACLLLSPQVASWLRFDDKFFFYGEDVALGAAIETWRVPVAYVPAALVEHEGSGSARNGSLFYEYHVVRGHWLLAKKLTHNRAGYVLAIGGRLLTLPLRATFRAARAHSWLPWKAFCMATCDVVSGRRRSLTPPAGGPEAKGSTRG
ncbi:hypothetical protein [Fulvimonas yonginensis]|uniref:GT2 family glycosyltransferase n=1 Tax=Fulvimonas yonginensis TaxID=1495200 RepID=A0ABU8JA64_9GAMM